MTVGFKWILISVSAVFVNFIAQIFGFPYQLCVTNMKLHIASLDRDKMSFSCIIPPYFVRYPLDYHVLDVKIILLIKEILSRLEV